MTVIGITGGTGAGKTTALSVLKNRGALIIDCDELYHSLLKNSDELKSALEERFPGVLTDGVIDRKALGKRVFSDENALKDLNAIAHRFVCEDVKRLLTSWESVGGKLAAIDAIALIESGLGDLCDFTVAVTAPADVRAERIMAREGISMEYAMLRIKAQKSEEFFRKNCSYMLINDCASADGFRKKCGALFAAILGGRIMADKNELFYKQKHIHDIIGTDEKVLAFEYCEGYKAFLDAAKTEREAVAEGIAQAEKAGFREYLPGMEITAGSKLYRSVRGKALILAIVGTEPLSEGAAIAAAHIDSPRLDLKQIPVYEDSELAYFRTHYYGGIKKYQWVTLPLALHGVVAKKDGTCVNVKIGEDPADPVLFITDLLPHLGKDQDKKTLGEAFTGENLNIIIGSLPADCPDTESDRVKLGVLGILNERYGITEEDFLSAELEAVPAEKARDLGLDRSLICAYGQDDRSCAYAELRAILDTNAPAKTAVCVLADKEEIGSVGVSGMQSAAFECFMADLCEAQGVSLRRCFEKSFCISADVCNAFDPNFPEVSEKRSNAKLNYGMGILKFTGARGKSGSNDASAEIIGRLRAVFEKNGVVWQMGELGKVDQGGGGTVALYMGNRNIDTIDAGVPVLSMHAPYEQTSKYDCYMTYKGIKAVYDEY